MSVHAINVREQQEREQQSNNGVVCTGRAELVPRTRRSLRHTDVLEVDSTCPEHWVVLVAGLRRDSLSKRACKLVRYVVAATADCQDGRSDCEWLLALAQTSTRHWTRLT